MTSLVHVLGSALFCYVEQIHLRGSECADKNGIRALKSSFGLNSDEAEEKKEWDKITV